MTDAATRVRGNISVHTVSEDGYRARIVFEGSGFSVVLKADQAQALAMRLLEAVCDA